MNYKELINKLATSQGEEASKIMSELGLIIKSASVGMKTTINSQCIQTIPKATDKRKGSLAFLISLLNIHHTLITDLLKEESPIIREQTVKGLLYQGENYVEILSKRLKDEPLYRIKKWILLTLGNIGTQDILKIIENTEVEPQLFSTKEKILSKFKKEKKARENVSGKSGTMIVQTAKGAEEKWLETAGQNLNAKHISQSGVRLGDGFIQLDEEFEFDKFANCRSVFYYGVMLGRVNEIKNVIKTRFNESEEYCVQYTNEIQGEKEKLSVFQNELAKNNWKYNSKAPLILQLLNENEAMLLIKPYIKENLEYLPASINRVVANVVNLIAEEEHGKANVILDPCCGSGTLLCEGKEIYQQSAAKNESRGAHQQQSGNNDQGTAKYIAIDKDETAIKKAKKNFEDYGIKGEFHNKRFQEVLLVKAADLVLGNPPFENRVKGEFDYNSLMKFISRNTTKNATIIIYTVKKSELREACKENGLVIKDEIKLRLKKIQPSVFVMKK